MVSYIEIKPSKILMNVGENTELSLDIQPVNAEAYISFTSDNTNVAKVDEYSGKVTAISNGTAKITATTLDGTGLSSESVVTVETRLTGISLETEKLKLGIGREHLLQVAFTPETATNKQLLYESSNKEIVNIDELGNIVGNSIGTAIITVTSKDGFHKAQIEIEVTTDAIEAIGLKVTPSEQIMFVGTSTTLLTEFNPPTTTDKTLKWTSNDELVATVDENTGKVTAIDEGKSVVTATTLDGKLTSSCAIQVSKLQMFASNVNMTSIFFGGYSNTKETIEVGQTFKFNVTWNPTNSNDQIYKTVANPSIISLTSPGIIYANDKNNSTGVPNGFIGLKKGTTTFKYYALRGSSSASATFTVDVKEANYAMVESISLGSSYTINVNENLTLSPRYSPSNHQSNIYRSSSDNSIVYVDKDSDTITGKRPGTAIVTYKASGGETATCTVTVRSPGIRKVEIGYDSFSEFTESRLFVGEQRVFKVRYEPSYEQNTVRGTSSNSKVATLTNNTVKAISPGFAEIVYTAASGAKAICHITVLAPQETIRNTKTLYIDGELNKNHAININQIYQYSITRNPNNANDHIYSEISNSSVAYFDNVSNTVRGLKAGKATITYKTSSGLKATINLTVNNTIQTETPIITTTVLGNGSITPNGYIPVKKGASQSFKFTPYTGYGLKFLLIDGILDANHKENYTFTNVQSSHTIKVDFYKLDDMPKPSDFKLKAKSYNATNNTFTVSWTGAVGKTIIYTLRDETTRKEILSQATVPYGNSQITIPSSNLIAGHAYTLYVRPTDGNTADVITCTFASAGTAVFANPDLMVEANSITIPNDITVGTNQTFGIDVKNIGRGKAEKFTVEARIDNVLVKTYSVTNLDAGATNKSSFTYTPTQIGTYNLVVTVKNTSNQYEDNGLNNTASKMFTAKALEYTITYNSNKETSGTVPKTQAFTNGSSVNLSTNTGGLVKTDFIFDGWNTNSSGTGTAYTEGQTVSGLTTSLKLYAKWTPIYDAIARALSNISNRIGSEPFEKTSGFFTELEGKYVPSTNIGKFNLFLTKLSDYSGEDVFSMLTTREKGIYEAKFGGVVDEYVMPGFAEDGGPDFFESIVYTKWVSFFNTSNSSLKLSKTQDGVEIIKSAKSGFKYNKYSHEITWLANVDSSNFTDKSKFNLRITVSSGDTASGPWFVENKEIWYDASYINDYTLKTEHNATKHYKFVIDIIPTSDKIIIKDDTNPIYVCINRTGRLWEWDYVDPVSKRSISAPPSTLTKGQIYDRPSSLRDTYKKWYDKQYNTNLDLSEVQVHHILPLEFGGNNSMTNLVPVPTEKHRGISGWFAGY